jgi:hypothetical protein
VAARWCLHHQQRAARHTTHYLHNAQQYQYLLTRTPHFLLLIFGALPRIDFHVSLKKSALFLSLTLSNSIFLRTAYSSALICFGRERGWWITCNYPTVLKEKNTEKQKEYNLRYLLAKVHTT